MRDEATRIATTRSASASSSPCHRSRAHRAHEESSTSPSAPMPWPTVDRRSDTSVAVYGTSLRHAMTLPPPAPSVGSMTTPTLASRLNRSRRVCSKSSRGIGMPGSGRSRSSTEPSARWWSACWTSPGVESDVVAVRRELLVELPLDVSDQGEHRGPLVLGSREPVRCYSPGDDERMPRRHREPIAERERKRVAKIHASSGTARNTDTSAVS